MPPPANEMGRSRANATSPNRSPDQRAMCEYARASSMRQVEIARIAKSARAELRVGIVESGARLRLYVRQYETTGAREMRATGKGIVFDASQLTTIVAALQSAASVITAAGNLPPSVGLPESEGNEWS